MRGHGYCTTRCAQDAGRNVTWRRIRTALIRPIPARLAVFLVALAACAPVILALRTVRDLDRINAPSAYARTRHETPWARLDSAVPTSNGLRIEGSASEGSAVFLFAADRFIAAAPVTQGRFRFEGVREQGPFRVGAMPLSASLGTLPAEVAAAPAREPQSGDGAAGSLPPAPAPRVRAAAPLPPIAPAGPAAPDLTRGPADRAEVLVSFDGGSSDNGASEILDALSARGIHTTIFLTGEFIRRYPAIVRRIAADGHEVGNHTDTHPHLTTYASDGRQTTRLGVDRAFLWGELARTARLYRETTGRPMAPLWRAPFGEHNPEIRRWAAQAGYWHVGWTGGSAGLDGLDWVSNPRSRSYQSADHLLSRLVRHAENGGIVLLHLGSDRDEPVASKIALLFDGLTARGFVYARASEFLERQGFDETRLAAFRGRSGSAEP
ncbi:MAG: polysaccharide deacetylase family protein [Acidobacteriota bacterium]